MATTRFIQDVRTEHQEFSASISVSEENDTIEFEFEGDFTVDEILLKGGGSNQYEVSFTYPKSQARAVLVDTGSFTSEWFLNEPNNRSRNWYRLPSKAVLGVTVVNSSPSSEQLSLLVMGRGN